MEKYYVGIRPKENYKYLLNFFTENYPDRRWHLLKPDAICYLFFLFERHRDILDEFVDLIHDYNIKLANHILIDAYKYDIFDIDRFLFENYMAMVTEKVFEYLEKYFIYSETMFDMVFDKLTNGPEMRPVHV